jgi:hypothetical protein
LCCEWEEGDVREVFVYVRPASPREGSEREAVVEDDGVKSRAPQADDEAQGEETEEAGSGEYNLSGAIVSRVEKI